MSHPYWPQPMYLYQRSQPHGPYPSAMGDYGSRYTHGSFTRRRTYALPPYVASERTGLEGLEPPGHPFEHGTTYYGFGSFQVGNMVITCDPATFIDKFVGKLPTAALLIKEPIRGILKSLTANAIQSLMLSVSKGQAAFETWFKINVSYNISQSTGGKVTQEMVNLVLPVMFNPINAALQECKQSVSTPMTFATGPRPIGVECAANSDCQSNYCGNMPYGQGKVCMTNPTPITPQRQITLVTPKWEPWKYAELTPEAAAWKEAEAAAAETKTTTKSGVGTAAVIGAAALAALVLLGRK